MKLKGAARKIAAAVVLRGGRKSVLVNGDEWCIFQNRCQFRGSMKIFGVKRLVRHPSLGRIGLL
jgi:hypothetical protein